MSHWDGMSENLLKPFSATSKMRKMSEPVVKSDVHRNKGAANVNSDGVVIHGPGLPKIASVARKPAGSSAMPYVGSAQVRSAAGAKASSSAGSGKEEQPKANAGFMSDPVVDGMFMRESRIFDLQDVRDNEFAMRVVRRDNRILNHDQFGSNYAAIEHEVRRMMNDIGMEHVIEVEIQKNAMIKLNRYGKPVLYGVRFTLHRNAPIWKLSVDYGRSASYTTCKGYANGRETLVQSERNKRTEDALLYRTFDPYTKQGELLDESMVSPSEEYYNTWKLRTPMRMGQDTSVASKAYDSCVLIAEGAMHGQSRHVGIYCDNHDPDAVATAERIMTQKQMTVEQFWQSDCYYACMTHGPMQTAALTHVFAQAAELQIKTYPFKYNNTSKDSTPVNLTVADLTYSAPMCFISPVKCKHIIENASLVEVEEFTAYQVFIGVMGDYSNAIPDVGRSTVSLMKPSARLRGELQLESQHVGYPYLHGPTAAVSIIMPLVARTDRSDQLVQYPMLWRMARQIDLDRVALENDSDSATVGVPRCPLHFSQGGFPTSGIYMGETAKTFGTIPDDVFVTGNTPHYRTSHNYVSFNRAGKLLESQMRVLLPMVISSETSGSYPVLLEYRGEVKFCAVGSINPEHMRLPAFVETVSKSPFVHVPLRNHTVVAQLITLATLMHNAIEYDGMDHELTRIHTAIMQRVKDESGAFGRKLVKADPFLDDISDGAMFYDRRKRLMFHRTWLQYAYKHFNPMSRTHDRERPIVPHDMKYYMNRPAQPVASQSLSS